MAPSIPSAARRRRSAATPASAARASSRGHLVVDASSSRAAARKFVKMSHAISWSIDVPIEVACVPSSAAMKRVFGRGTRPRHELARSGDPARASRGGRAKRRAESGTRASRRKGAVAREPVVLHEVARRPRAAHLPERPLRRCPCSGSRARRRSCSARRTRASHRSRARGAALSMAAHAVDEIEERSSRLREVRHLGRPVVHLDVDVDVIVGAPRRLQLLVPEALEVGRHAARARRRDQAGSGRTENRARPGADRSPPD